jgi:hypothetical protein
MYPEEKLNCLNWLSRLQAQTALVLRVFYGIKNLECFIVDLRLAKEGLLKRGEVRKTKDS